MTIEENTFDEPLNDQVDLKKKRHPRTRLLIIVISVTVPVLFLILSGSMLTSSQSNDEQIRVILDEVVLAFNEKDAESAYEFFAPWVQESVSINEIYTLIELKHNSYADYQSLTVTSIEYEEFFGRTVAELKGTVAFAEGVIYYSNGNTSSVEATFQQIGDEWKLIYFDIFANLENASISTLIPPEAWKQSASITLVLEEFFLALKESDIERTSNLFDASRQGEPLKESLQGYLNEDSYWIFESFQNVKITEIEIVHNSALAEITEKAFVTAESSYDSKGTLTITAELVKIEEQWYLVKIGIY